MNEDVQLHPVDIVILIVVLNSPADTKWRTRDVYEMTDYSISHVREGFRRLGEYGALQWEPDHPNGKVYRLVAAQRPALCDLARNRVDAEVQWKIITLGLERVLEALAPAAGGRR
ncbi:hypothetical protein JNUCC0626_20190 [Lentzea sp. JNUCC 0626]|uniref:hypothetical protein n=1 Tax=Lentzea sp. JNUCC 0626 TaxID=3367513 RepID=UPI00374919F3